MEEIITLIMKRDEVTREEAKEMIRAAQEEIEPYVLSGDYDSIEEVLRDELQLEPDYIEYFIL